RAPSRRHRVRHLPRAVRDGALLRRVPARRAGDRVRAHVGPAAGLRPGAHRARAPLEGPAMADRRGLKIAVGTAAIGAVLLALALWARDRTPDVAPDFAVPDLSGQAVRLSAYRGQVVLVNIWATWCPPCREEMPSMERLYGRLKDRGFVLLAVSQDEGPVAGVKAFVDQMKLTFP